jgi:hypothetical protein
MLIISSRFLDEAIDLMYDNKLQRKANVHLRLLSDRSPKLLERFDQAEPLRKDYLHVKSIRQEAKALLPPKTSREAFFGNNVDQNVAQVCFNHIHVLNAHAYNVHRP